MVQQFMAISNRLGLHFKDYIEKMDSVHVALNSVAVAHTKLKKYVCSSTCDDTVEALHNAKAERKVALAELATIVAKIPAVVTEFDQAKTAYHETKGSVDSLSSTTSSPLLRMSSMLCGSTFASLSQLTISLQCRPISHHRSGSRAIRSHLFRSNLVCCLSECQVSTRLTIILERMNKRLCSSIIDLTDDGPLSEVTHITGTDPCELRF